ncbi:helix-turn-helix domain-containing protein [Companilactobacillus tucceti]|nr:helix-turn-helix transcriptional regulator [Companilactobacillus tucceti]
MRIGDQLQKQRKLHDMSQNELADKLHISRQSISKWENGATLPSFSNVLAISDLFNVSLDELIRGDEELMNKFEDDKIRLSKTETIFIIGSLAVLVGLIVIYSNGISIASVDDWLPDIGFISFLCFVSNIKWDIFNKSLNKKAVVFGIILLVAVLVPYIMHGVPSLLEGLRKGTSY